MSRHLFAVSVIALCVGLMFLPTGLQSQEKDGSAKSVATAKPGAESLALMQMLDLTIDTKGLQERVKLKTALEYFSNKTDGKLPILIDREAFAVELGADAPDPYEEEV